MNDIKERYRFQSMDGILDKIRFWFLIRKIRRDKQLIVWEANMDKVFYETNFEKELSFNDATARQKLSDELKKPVETQDKSFIENIENEISTAKAVKANYRKNREFIDEANNYINMIDQWKNQA